MTATRTARERARAELTQEIKDEARRQLADVGAHGLSLRAVARELGMVSSALYRYFPSRDRLLTDLIVDAYNAIGEAAENGDPGKGEPRDRWLAIWQATRAWARAHPHEYALIYGSPIPGYEAPQDTVVPASRVALALVKVLTNTTVRAPDEVSPELRAQAETLTKALGIIAGPETVTRLLMAWTQLFGAISFELFGQYVGSVDPADAFFAHSAKRMAEFVGL
ncbi:TetR/AcrR family transcriptional regulator [Amycolatopsis sp. SID8362]|uniref:TetR/AcrR family transcriptional regulator n=1 Tax=Amycolatopsis sp. SID8362 TaxID=2690346 RepID=UPI0013700AEF|nr:TetR/AcrR family transcriptional regulator [Amycolatopsis sp. SID8362]NBH02707.1 TetR family transcriptional regulator [Amycolatopsis sp. SID8362]NED39409.1 TetR/AcrR family transcriptional regulator [Amycolatopsis sp. SID8362]